MGKRRIKLFSETTTIRVDESLYGTCQELMDIFTNISGASTYQQPFMTLSETILTLTSYSITSDNGLLSKNEKYLKGLFAEATKKPASLTITLEYGDTFTALIDSLSAKYKSMGIKLSFTETVRIALLNFAKLYNIWPEVPLLNFFVLMSSSDPVISNLSENDRLINITSFKYPEFAPALKTSLKRYYLNLPDLFLNNIDKGLNGSMALVSEKINIWLPMVSNYKEDLKERAFSITESATNEMAFLGYLIYMSANKKIVDKAGKDALHLGAIPSEMYSSYYISPLSYLPFLIFGSLPFYHSDFKNELSDVIMKIINPEMKKITDEYFS